MEYFLIIDSNKIGKIENFIPYLYDEHKGWVVDNDNILMDRLLGYDGESIGDSSDLFKIDKITEEEAMKIINEK